MASSAVAKANWDMPDDTVELLWRDTLVSTTKVDKQSRQTSKYYRLASSVARGVVNFSTSLANNSSTSSSR